MRQLPLHILSAILLISTSIQATPTLESLLANRSTTRFPDYQSNGLIMNAHSSERVSYQMTFKKNGRGLMVDISTKLTQSNLQLDAQFNVLSSTFTITDAELIKKTKYNQRSAHRNQLDEVNFTYYLNKQLFKLKTKN